LAAWLAGSGLGWAELGWVTGCLAGCLAGWLGAWSGWAGMGWAGLNPMGSNCFAILEVWGLISRSKGFEPKPLDLDVWGLNL